MFEEKVQRLRQVMGRNEYDDALERLQRHAWFRKLDGAARDRMIKNTFACADRAYANLLERFGPASPTGYAQKLGVELRDSEDMPSELFLHFALFQTPPPMITLTLPSIRLAEAYIRSNGLEGLFGDVSIREFAVAHELYHVLEDAGPDCCTGNAAVERRVLGVKIKSAAPPVLGEIAARRFSQQLMGTGVTPSSLEMVLVYAFREYDEARQAEHSKTRWDAVLAAYTTLRPNKKY